MSGWRSIVGRVFGVILLIPLLILFVPIILILNWLGLDKINAGPDYVMDYLERFIAGSEGARDWDDFCSIPLKNPKLDDIRLRACEFAPPSSCVGNEKEKLQHLLEEAKRIGQA